MNRQRTETRAAALLHNMSMMPSAPLQFSGRDMCRLVAIGPSLLDTLKGTTAVLRFWCGTIGLPADDASRRAGLLRDAAARVDKLLVLPPVVPVCQGCGGDHVRGISDDHLLMLAVMSRTAGSVFIRCRSPIITAESLGEGVTLLLPKSWRYTPC